MLKFTVALFFGVLAFGQVRISQVYGGGGNSGATLTNDFIELFNAGSGPASLAGWSVQYASAGGDTWQKTDLPNAILQPGQYFLIQEAPGAGGVVHLPAPDVADGAIPMSATAGKVALVASQIAITNSACPGAELGVVDLIGYGAANCFKGTGPAPALTNTTAALRSGNGCQDTGQNGNDFITGPPAPRNSASPLNVCSGGTNPSAAGSANPDPATSGSSTNLTVIAMPGANPASTGMIVTCDLSRIGGSASLNLVNTTANTFTATYAIPVLTAPGAYSLPCRIADGQSRSSGFAVTLTVQLPPPIDARINQVNGSGVNSPKANTSVTVQGIVTALRPLSGSTRGFYIQSLPGDVDADPSTSEGLLVFTGSTNPPPCAAVGNAIRISGLVQDFVSSAAPAASVPLTELAFPDNCIVLSTGNTLPDAIVIDDKTIVAGGSANQARKLLGMRVAVPAAVVVGPSLGSLTESSATSVPSGTFFVTLAGVDRPSRGAGILATRRPADAPASVPSWNGAPEVLRVVTTGLAGGKAFEAATGAVITGLTGVMDLNTSQGQYQIYTDAAGAGTLTPAIQAGATPVPAPLDTDLTIGDFNIQRFYNDLDEGNGAGAQLTTAAYQGRLQKLSLAIRNVMLAPDIVALEEVEAPRLGSPNPAYPVIQDIANRINMDAVAAGEKNPNYGWCMYPTNDPSAIGVAFLFKQDKVAPVDCSQYGGGAIYVEPGNTIALLNDRPPLVLFANVKRPGSNSVLPVRIVANHLRSLDTVDEPGLAFGDRVRTKRNEQAEYLANLVMGKLREQSSNWNATDNLVVLGDFNAYEVNDGYVDVMGCISGMPAPPARQYFTAAQLAVSSPCTPITNPPLTNLTSADPANRYSYTFSGVTETLDHVLVNSLLWPRVRQIVYARNDADYPDGPTYRNNFARPERVSDHDMAVLYIALPAQ